MLFNPVSDSWSAGPTTVFQQLYYQAEAAWVKLADGSILTVDGDATSSERYIPAANDWISDATVPVALYDPYGEEERAGFAVAQRECDFFRRDGTYGHLYTFGHY